MRDDRPGREPWCARGRGLSSMPKYHNNLNSAVKQRCVSFVPVPRSCLQLLDC